MSLEAPVGQSEGADPAVVGPYLAAALGDPRWRDCTVGLISGGKSNLTYGVTSAAGEVVVRRPPLAGGLPTAHDMVREHTVLAALAGTDVPVPRVRALCADPAVLGVPFYVMERVDGHVIRGELPDGYATTEAARAAIAVDLVDVLAKIHAVGIPGRLDGYGKPSGYLERQVRRWKRQWEASKLDELPLLDALADDLEKSLPEQRETTLVHGDYRMDNTMLSRTEPGRVIAVLDWEMSTLGDPLADVGLLCVYWATEDEVRPLTPTVTGLAGFPDRREVIGMYAERSGRDVSALPWYVAFGYFKLAVVAAGIAARVRLGGMIGDGFESAGDVVPSLIEAGTRVLANGEVG